MVGSIMDPRDKVILILFAKTGIRRSEMLIIGDVNWVVCTLFFYQYPQLV